MNVEKFKKLWDGFSDAVIYDATVCVAELFKYILTRYLDPVKRKGAKSVITMEIEMCVDCFTKVIKNVLSIQKRNYRFIRPFP